MGSQHVIEVLTDAVMLCELLRCICRWHTPASAHTLFSRETFARGSQQFTFTPQLSSTSPFTHLIPQATHFEVNSMRCW